MTMMVDSPAALSVPRAVLIVPLVLPPAIPQMMADSPATLPMPLTVLIVSPVLPPATPQMMAIGDRLALALLILVLATDLNRVDG